MTTTQPTNESKTMDAIKEKLFNAAADFIGRSLTKSEAMELWHNYTQTTCIDTDIEDAIERTFEAP